MSEETVLQGTAWTDGPARNGNLRAAFRLVMSMEPLLDAPRSVQELNRQMDVQKATWRTQRIGWWVLLLFSLLGLAGLLGGGPLAKTTAHSGNTEVEYEYILRREGDSTVTFDMAALDGRAVVTLPLRYLEAAEIVDIQPEPIAVFSGPDAQTFVFAAPHERTSVSLRIRARQIGQLKFTPNVNGQAVPTRLPVVLP